MVDNYKDDKAIGESNYKETKKEENLQLLFFNLRLFN